MNANLHSFIDVHVFSFQNDKDQENFKKLLGYMSDSKEGKTVGVFQKDSMVGEFCQSWKTAVDDKKFENVDIGAAIAYIIAPKEESEILTMKKACMVSVDIFSKYLKDNIMEIIDADKVRCSCIVYIEFVSLYNFSFVVCAHVSQKVKHAKLAEGVEAALTDKKYVTGVDTSQLDMCYPAIIQSGGIYSLKFSVMSDKNYLHFGSIVCSLGARYKSYCSNISRTFLVNPTDRVQDHYNFVLNLEEELLKKLVPGSKLNEVYDTCVAYAKKEKPELIDHLTKTFGFALGIEFRESSLIIGPKCNAVIKKNMVFNVYVGLSGLTNKEASDKEGKVYALFVGDSVN